MNLSRLMPLLRGVQFIQRLFSGIIKHNIGALAAVIAFFGFSSMIPLVLLMIYGASFLIPNTPIEPFIEATLKSYTPEIPNSSEFLSGNLSRLTLLGPKIGILAIPGFLWSALGGFVSFQQILDIIWDTRKRRPFFKQYLAGSLMLFILLVLTIVSSLATSISPVFVHRLLGGTTSLHWLLTMHVFSHAAFILLMLMTCFACYRILPSRLLSNLHLAAGALISTAGIYATRFLFVVYTAHLGRYHLIYGSLTFIMLFIFWIYIVSIIILFGGEVAVTLDGVARENAKKGPA